jgi:hypothetical protein
MTHVPANTDQDGPQSFREVSFRWHALIAYQTAHGVSDVEYDFDEMSDLDLFIERGPPFTSILGITVTYTGYLRPDMSLQITEDRGPHTQHLDRIVEAHYRAVPRA